MLIFLQYLFRCDKGFFKLENQLKHMKKEHNVEALENW